MTSTTRHCVIIGKNSTSEHSFTIVLGDNLITTDQFQLVFGTAESPKYIKLNANDYFNMRDILVRYDD